MATYRRSDLLKQEDLEKRSMKKRMLTGGQAKLDKNKDNKIDAQDFKILKAEKAKGRGMGLQDESIKPGKVMKAKRGKFLGSDPTKPISSVKPLGTLGKGMKVSKAHSIVLGKMSNEKLKEMVKTGINPDLKGDPNIKRGSQKTSMEAKSFLDRRKELASPKNILNAAKATRYGKIALGIAGVALGAKELLKSKMKKEDKKMVGGMAKKYSVGGGADMGDPKKPTAIPKGKDSEVMVHNLRPSDDPNFRAYAAPKKRRRYFVGSKPDKARKYAATPGNLPKPAIGKMGGGMMQRPMGYKSGTMVKARGCKLGRTRPTKMY